MTTRAFRSFPMSLLCHCCVVARSLLTLGPGTDSGLPTASNVDGSASVDNTLDVHTFDASVREACRGISPSSARVTAGGCRPAVSRADRDAAAAGPRTPRTRPARPCAAECRRRSPGRGYGHPVPRTRGPGRPMGLAGVRSAHPSAPGTGCAARGRLYASAHTGPMEQNDVAILIGIVTVLGSMVVIVLQWMRSRRR